MKCTVCGAESGTYQFCRSCYEKKEKGLIMKCAKCGKWHEKEAPCQITVEDNGDSFLYEAKAKLLSNIEQEFFSALKQTVPEGYSVFPQINLATFVERTDNARYRNELFRNVDFLICGVNYEPKIAVEINDSTHNNRDRIERDTKVKNILEEAGIPFITLWTNYGVNSAYIKERIEKALEEPAVRCHHFDKSEKPMPSSTDEWKAPVNQEKQPAAQPKKKGCYVATCVYGSYDCPQVWVLRRYRDNRLNKSWYGRLFIKLYYSISPSLVALFGETAFFRSINRSILDRMVGRLQREGFENTPYID